MYSIQCKLTPQWRNTHWTRLDKCQGPTGSRGPQASPYFLYILIFQVLGVSHLFYSTADFFVNVLRPSSSYIIIIEVFVVRLLHHERRCIT